MKLIHKINQVFLLIFSFFLCWTNQIIGHSLQFPHQDIYSMFRFYNQPKSRSMSVFGREGKGEVGQNESYKYLEFNHGQVLSKTHSGPNSKRHIQVWKFARPCNSICKSFWVELVSIWSPYLWISMQCQHHGPKVDTLRDINVPKFHVL